MLVSALCSAATDLAFSPQGYAWQMLNNLFTAAYSLRLRAVIMRMSVITSKQGGVDEVGMVVYNNLLSIPMIGMLVILTGELSTIWHEPALGNPHFLLAAGTSAVLSFLISVASMWFLSCTTATTFSLVGSLNKIPLALVGMCLFKAPTTANNVASVLVGLIAGVVFAHAKTMDGRRQAAAVSSSGGNMSNSMLPIKMMTAKSSSNNLLEQGQSDNVDGQQLHAQPLLSRFGPAT
eukprot:jgi/Chrzof1/12782/Cz07g07120.t1